jgi:hypothetical protein
MDHLRDENFDSARVLLKNAEEILASEMSAVSTSLHAITLNNLGCYYKRLGNPQLALDYLTKALAFGGVTETTNLAGTNLNICAIYS